MHNPCMTPIVRTFCSSLTETGNSGSSFSFLSPLKTWKIKILKKWKCVPKTTIIWGMVPEIWSETDRIFSHFGPFFGFYPSNNPENQNLKKWTNHLEMSSFYTCVTKIIIIWCMLPEIWSVTDIFFVILGHFLPF